MGDVEALRRELLDMRAKLVKELEEIVDYMNRSKPEWLYFNVDRLEPCIRGSSDHCYLLLNDIAWLEFYGTASTYVDEYEKTLELVLSSYPGIKVKVKIPDLIFSEKIWFTFGINKKDVPDSIRNKLYDVLRELEPDIWDMLENSITLRAARIIASLEWIDKRLKYDDILKRSDTLKKLEKIKKKVAA